MTPETMWQEAQMVARLAAMIPRRSDDSNGREWQALVLPRLLPRFQPLAHLWGVTPAALLVVAAL